MRVIFAAYITDGSKGRIAAARAQADSSLVDWSEIRSDGIYYGRIYTSIVNNHLQNYNELYAHNSIMRDPNPGFFKQLYAIIEYTNKDKQTFII